MSSAYGGDGAAKCFSLSRVKGIEPRVGRFMAIISRSENLLICLKKNLL